MTKDKVLEVAGDAGKLAIRGVAYVGVNAAVIGGGLFYSILLARRFKRAAVQTAVFTAGASIAALAGYLVGDMVDEHITDKYDLEVY